MPHTVTHGSNKSVRRFIVAILRSGARLSVSVADARKLLSSAAKRRKDAAAERECAGCQQLIPGGGRR